MSDDQRRRRAMEGKATWRDIVEFIDEVFESSLDEYQQQEVYKVLASIDTQRREALRQKVADALIMEPDIKGEDVVRILLSTHFSTLKAAN